MKCKREACEHYHGLFRTGPCLDCKRWVKQDNYKPIKPKEVDNMADNCRTAKVILQENGIIRSLEGIYIGRIDNDEFDIDKLSDHYTPIEPKEVGNPKDNP